LAEINPAFGTYDMPLQADWVSFGADGKADKEPFEAAVKNFYQTDSVTRASKTMAQCVEAVVNNGQKAKTGTHD
jgi:NADH-quinone oxidoreductase subunit G